MNTDKSLLMRAVDIAGGGIELGGGPFGAVIAKDGKIVTEAFNEVILTNDPTAHAEIIAIRKASSQLKSHDLAGCTLYSSCEPCPMCLGAIYWAGIKKVVYASDRNDAEKAGFSDRMIYKEIILDPSKRKIEFLRIIDVGENEIFKKWDMLENKTPY